jgi:putative FmdB family regulatory protein
MPIYEYRCSDCPYTIERFYRSIPRVIPEELREKCPNCGETDASFKKIVSRSGFILGKEGVGWSKEGYSTDSQDGSKIASITEPK